MAAFASAIGGAGNAAAQYGQQIRGILEQRRGGMVELFSRLANEEPDPSRRAEYHSITADLLSGKDMSKVGPAALKTLQNHVQSNQALSQLVGGPPQPPAQKPAPAGPGQVPGTATAAQPDSSPVQPRQQQAPAQTPVPTPGQAPDQSAQAPQAAPQPAETIPGLPPGATQPQSIQDIYQKWSQHPYMQTPAGRAILKPFIDQEVAHNQALQQAIEQKQLEMAYRRQGYQSVKGSPGFESLPQFMQTGYAAEGGGLNPIALPVGSLTPRLMSGGTLGEQLPPGATEMGTSKPVQSGVLYREEMSPLTGSMMYVPIAPHTENTQTPGGLQVSNKLTGGSIAPIQGAIPGVMNTPKTMPTAGGGVEMISPAQVAAGQGGMQVPGAVSPAMMPHTTTGETSVQTVDASGNPVTQRIPTQSTRTIGGGAPKSLPTPSGGSAGKQFEKPLTPLQQVTSEQKLAQYNMAIDRAQRVIQNSHLLDSMLESGKMQLQLHDGILASIINRNVSLTPAEAQMVTDFNSLRESVNLVRGPLGATGFRGPEAFSALQAQRGSLLGRPEITRGILQNFVKELQNQSAPLAKKLRQPDSGATGGAATPTHRFNPATGKIEVIQ